jgi:hypothetical protein
VKNNKRIPAIVYRIKAILVAMMSHLPKGTQYRIYQVLAVLMSGILLETRGALIPALDKANLEKNEVLRCREALQEGK